MMKQEIKIGVVCVARKTFDYKAAEAIYSQIKEDLKKIEKIEWHFISDLVIEIKEAQQAADYLARKQVDGLVCISGTFALGHLILELNKKVQRPILLWGLEELPYDGGKIRLNSVCGINLNSSNLYKAGVKNYHVVIGKEIDVDWLDAIRILRAFSSSHIGIIGYRAKGFFNLDVDELDLYRELGILIDHYELNEVFSLEVDDAQVNQRREQIKDIFDGLEFSETAMCDLMGPFMKRGIKIQPLDRKKKCEFIPKLKKGDNVVGGDIIGTVQETSVIEHRIIMPPNKNKPCKKEDCGPYYSNSNIWILPPS